MVTKRMRGFHRFLKTVESFTDGQVQVTDWDCDHLGWVKINVKPNDGFYKGGVFKFQICMNRQYPDEPPAVQCQTDILHPNIDPTYEAAREETNVCVSTLDEWQNGMGLEDVVQGLLFLFHNPNPGDALSPYYGGFSDEPEEWDDFKDNVLTAMKGGEVDGHKFEYCWCGETDGRPTDNKENADTQELVKDGACAIPEDKECPNKVDIIITKINEIILKRTEEGKGESDDEMEDPDDPDDGEDGEDDEVDSTVCGEDVGENAQQETLSDELVECEPNCEVPNCEVQNCQNEQAPQTSSQEELIIDTTVEGATSQIILSRQNSKLAKDTDVITNQGSDASQCNDLIDNCNAKDLNETSRHDDDELAGYFQRHKMCSFVAPDFDLGLHALSVICLYSIYRTFKHG